MTTETAIKKLKEIQQDSNETDLMHYVADITIDELDGYSKAEDYFNDLMRMGCQSGMISELIYYRDTHKFYDEHYEDIEGMREDYQDETGVTLEPKGDLKNWFAWFAFEETSRELAIRLGIEV